MTSADFFYITTGILAIVSSVVLLTSILYVRRAVIAWEKFLLQVISIPNQLQSRMVSGIKNTVAKILGRG